MTRSAACLTVLCLAGTFGTARAVHADTIQINSGSLDFGYSSGVLTVSGDGGFWMQVSMGITGGIYGPWEKCSVPECGSGVTIPLNAYWSGNDLPGTAVYQGNTYPHLGGLDPTQSAAVQFFGEAIAPSLQVGSSAIVTAPFTFKGLFLQPVDADPYVVYHDLVGAGTATLWLEKGYGGTSWRVMSSRYEFSPVPTPEPATLLLVGSGLAIAFARRRVRSSRR